MSYSEAHKNILHGFASNNTAFSKNLTTMSYFPFPLNPCSFPFYSPELDYRAILSTGFVILQSQPTMDSLNQSLFPVLFKISQHYLFPIQSTLHNSLKQRQIAFIIPTSSHATKMQSF